MLKISETLPESSPLGQQKMKIRLEQLNPVIGDLEGNRSLILKALKDAVADRVDLLVLPEMVLTGYPAEDLLEYGAFREACYRINEEIAARTGRTALLFGTLTPNRSGKGRKMFNSALLCHEGRVTAYHEKILLPTYDVFDDLRYFEPGRDSLPLSLGDVKLGVTICEDIWYNENEIQYHHYERNPAAELKREGAGILINLSASPFTRTKHENRTRMLRGHATGLGIPVLYCNQTGAQSGLLFDGDSMAFDASGRLVASCRIFEHDRLDLQWDPGSGSLVAENSPGDADASGGEGAPGEEERVWKALKSGIVDYLGKSGLPQRLVVGVSGGLDSALVLALACEAAGSGKVTALALPSGYTPEESMEDARKLAANLGVRLLEIPIRELYELFLTVLEPWFSGRPFDETEENLQSRIRGDLLMAWANKFGGLLLTTGNKSELSVGYATLYGDMNGGLNPIGDLWKTEVYQLCHWLNRDHWQREVIPERILVKPPSAELRPDQKDSDSLPEYDLLDAILRLHIERQLTPEEIVGEGFPEETVRRVVRLVGRSEFKRFQAPPILRISPKSVGYGRRMPLVQRAPFYR